MPYPDDRDTERYETRQPENPPNSVLHPEVRRTAVWTYLGIIAAVFVLAGGALLYWMAADPEGRQSGPEPSAIGTSGDRMPEEDTSGGFDPQPGFDETTDELDHRGGDPDSHGSAPALGEPVSDLSVFSDESASLAGRRAELDDVEVERSEGGTFVVHERGARVTVVAPGNSPTVRAGQRVNVVGVVEQDGGQTRIRASRIDVR
jgi:hypothetical protein